MYTTLYTLTIYSQKYARAEVWKLVRFKLKLVWFVNDLFNVLWAYAVINFVVCMFM